MKWQLKLKDRVICTFDTEMEAISAHLACIRVIGILGDRFYNKTLNDAAFRETTDMILDLHVEAVEGD